MDGEEKILSAIKGLQETIEHLRNDFKDKDEKTQAQIRENTTKIENHEQKLNKKDKEERKKNIIIHGIDEEEKNTSELEVKCLKIINEQLRVKTAITEIDRVIRLGFKTNNKNRPVLIKCLASRKVLEILRSKKNLKNTNIYITEDLPKEVMEERKQLLPILKYLRETGKYTIIKYDTIFVNGKSLEGEELLRIKEELKGKKRNRSEDYEEAQAEAERKRTIQKWREYIEAENTTLPSTAGGQRADNSKDRHRSNSLHSIFKQNQPIQPTISEIFKIRQQENVKNTKENTIIK